MLQSQGPPRLEKFPSITLKPVNDLKRNVAAAAATLIMLAGVRSVTPAALQNHTVRKNLQLPHDDMMQLMSLTFSPEGMEAVN